MTTLAERAEELRQRARLHARRGTDSNEAQRLRDRQGQCKRLADHAERLVAALATLRTGGVRVSLDTDFIQRMRTEVAGARQRFAENPATITQSNPFDVAELERTLKGVERDLLAVWQRSVNAPHGDELADTLDGVPAFRPVAARLRELNASLRQCASRLPANGQAMQAPDRIRAEIDLAIGRLNLSRGVIRVLERAQRRELPLLELLADEALVDELRERGILACLWVVL